MELYPACFLSIFFLCLCPLFQLSSPQQTYPSTDQLQCSNDSSTVTKGYLCYGSGPQTSCQSYATYRSRPPYDSPIRIAYLLGSDAPSIALINNISPSDKIPPENLVIVPIFCSCNGSIYQHNTPYSIQRGQYYFLISNNTFQGLTTCQALFDQNNYNETNIPVNALVTVPVRCACPSAIQKENGVSSLLVYMVSQGDNLTSIANDFGVVETSILDANLLPQESTIYPSTPLLIPLKSESCSKDPGKFFCNCLINGSSPDGNHCRPNGKSFPVKLVTILGTSIGLGIVFVCLSGSMLFRFLKKKRNKMQKERMFKQNGGYLLQKELSSNGSVEKAKIFTAEELQRATYNYNQSRFLGQGGFGTVYKGMLPDGDVVAVKRSKAIDKSQIKQFINEVVILSQINHRNIVKLLGCCLETEVPILVYEFIPNGTLHHHIHDHQQEQESSLSWEHRLRIACEVAGALAYMHSAASIPIFHRDIKSSNILLDDKYSAKVSDFGTSRSIPNDKTHLTTAVQGTFGYLDPEYFQSSQFTDKSDVYSFGVVLIELLTGKKPISFAREADQINLVAYFISLAKENKLLQVLDDKVAKEASKEEIRIIAELAMRCLRLSGKKRPTMKQVALELEGLRRSQNCLEIYQEPDQLCREEISFVDTTEETSGQGSTADSMAFSLQMESTSF